MEKINQNNYEAWFLDYHEGSLCAEDVAELMLFLEKHTELKEEFESFENITLELPLIPCVFEGKEKMRKPVITLENYEIWFVDAADGILDEDSMRAVNYFLKEHPELESGLEACKNIHLTPDLSIVFEGKEKLLKRIRKEERGRIIPFSLPAYRYIAAAASLALILGIWFYNQPVTKWGDGNMYGMVENLSLKNQKKESYTLPVPSKEASRTPVAVKAIAVAHPSKSDQKQEVASTLPEIQEMQRRDVPLQLFLNSQPDPEMPMNSIAAVNATVVPSRDESTGQPLNLKEFASRKLQDAIGISRESDKGKRHPGWEVAKVAVRGLNRVSPRKIKIKEEYDDRGTLVSYALNTGDLEYSRTGKK